MAVERGPALHSCPDGGDPSTRRPVVESVGERGTIGKSEVGPCVVMRGEFREGGIGQRSLH